MIRQGDWIQTFSGKRFYVFDPREEDIDIIDIAHSLSLLCRFNGHCSRFYSVAEHSILMAACIEQEGGSRQQCLEAIVHDGPEAYLSDVPRPIKHSPEMLPYREAEKRVERMLFGKFGLPWPMSTFIKWHDNRALMTERRDLVPNAHMTGWTGKEAPFWPDNMKLYPDEPYSWLTTPKMVEQRFLEDFFRFGGVR